MSPVRDGWFKNPGEEPQPATIRGKLEALAAEECNGADEYRDCTVHSLKAQAMAKALLTLITDEERWPGQNGDHEELLKELDTALERANTI